MITFKNEFVTISRSEHIVKFLLKWSGLEFLLIRKLQYQSVVSFSRSFRSEYCVISANNSCQFKARLAAGWAGVTIDLQSRADRRPEPAWVTPVTDSVGQKQTQGSSSSGVWRLQTDKKANGTRTGEFSINSEVHTQFQ